MHVYRNRRYVGCSLSVCHQSVVWHACPYRATVGIGCPFSSGYVAKIKYPVTVTVTLTVTVTVTVTVPRH